MLILSHSIIVSIVIVCTYVLYVHIVIVICHKYDGASLENGSTEFADIFFYVFVIFKTSFARKYFFGKSGKFSYNYR